MKVYIVAHTSGNYMFPIGASPKIYKTKAGAQKAYDDYMKKHPETTDLKILYANNWQEER